MIPEARNVAALLAATALLLGGCSRRADFGDGAVVLAYAPRLPEGAPQAERLAMAGVVRDRLERRLSGSRTPARVELEGDRVLVKVPAKIDPSELERIKGFLPVPARFEFRSVDGKALAALADRVPAPSAVARDQTQNPETARLLCPTSMAAELALKALQPLLRPDQAIAFDVPSSGVGRWMGYLLGPVVVDNDGVARASTAWDEGGRPLVTATLTEAASIRFAELTRGSIGRQIAITLDGKVLTAPYVTSPITDGRIQITLGKGGQDEANTLALVLKVRAALPVPLDLVEERRIPAP